MDTQLPQLTEQQLADNEALNLQIKQKINELGGFLAFVDYMNLALYSPKYGYYSGRVEKIGIHGDFTTSPQLTDLFGKSLANQVQQILPQTAGNLYEFGAGTGKLAVDILNALPENVCKKYYIIELSADLQERQKEYIAKHSPQHIHKIEHLYSLPETFDGIILGNEVLDAMPCEIVEKRDDVIYRMGVKNTQQGFDWAEEKATGLLLEQALHKLPNTNETYRTEINLYAQAFVKTIAERLRRGGILWIDYGFDANEYYHPQRSMGTLIGHYQHRTIDNPFMFTGQMDLTAHVNFSDIADSSMQTGIDFIGYTNQANFLIACGITDLLAQIGDSSSHEYIKSAAACQKLLNPHEMGELFKCIAFSKNIDTDWLGFSGLDLSHKL
ncbi:MAG: SAM-dependent methyltransferase [Neisseriaceae bacterium]|nr:SAM-dependent methyltransferase [Neisseriaceae bacterium]